MSRFFISPDQIHGTRFRLAGSEAHHALHVLRKQVGDSIDLFDGKDRSYVGRIDRLVGDAIEGEMIEEHRMAVDQPRVWLLAGLIKGPRWDWLLEKASEVGVDRLTPVTTSRTVVHFDPNDVPAKLSRWRRIALESAKQCGRPVPMEVVEPLSFSEGLASLDPRWKVIIPWEKESLQGLRAVLAEKNLAGCALCIGPEGGWSEDEVAEALRKGATPVTLGPLLLRSETACIVAAALARESLLASHSGKMLPSV